MVNCAGVVSGKSFLDLSESQIERTMSVNTMALFWTAKAFLPEMMEAGSGHLVTMASAAGTIGVAGLADYCASKWAAVGLDESLRVELKQRRSGREDHDRLSRISSTRACSRGSRRGFRGSCRSSRKIAWPSGLCGRFAGNKRAADHAVAGEFRALAADASCQCVRYLGQLAGDQRGHEVVRGRRRPRVSEPKSKQT